MKKLSDQELIEKIVDENDSVYFAELFSRYREKVYNKCYSMVKRKSVADDLVQDVMVKAMTKMPTFQKKSSFSTWLYSITYNHCIEYLKRHRRVQFQDWEETLDIPEEAADDDVREVLDLKSSRLTLLLEMLVPQDKALILLKYQEGFDLKKIMYILSLDGESATKMRISRAKKRLLALYSQFYNALEE